MFIDWQKQILVFYKKFSKKYPIVNSQWAFWCKKNKSIKEREKVIIEAILTQQTNWNNVEKAMANLEEVNKDNLRAIYFTPSNQIEKLIRPAGFYKTKTRYLKNICKFFIKNGGIKNLEKKKLKDLRKALLKIKGVGPETADSILLYAFHKPIFVVDAYTKRWVKEFKLPIKKNSYANIQNFFMNLLPKKFTLYQKIHAIIVMYYKSLK
ncbi:MAG: endonuclease [Patescibacteria group bacterium]|jgi:endonuclease-3 related protein|nr:endonuclease [Patescibacteria group bacterium]